MDRMSAITTQRMAIFNLYYTAQDSGRNLANAFSSRLTPKATFTVIKQQGFFFKRHQLYPNCVATFQQSRLILFGDIAQNSGPTSNKQLNDGDDICHLDFQLDGKGIKVCQLNVRSHPRHFDEIQALVRVNKFDIFLVCETWLNSTWQDSEIDIDG